MDKASLLIRLQVTPEETGTCLGDFLRRRLGLSRGMLRRLRTQQGLLVDGVPQRVNYPLPAGAEVALMYAEAASVGVAPEPMALVVLFEDDDLLALNKPPGVMVHPAHGHLSGTLANGVAAYFAARGLEVPVRPISRLDRDTSGVVLIAKNPWVHARLANAKGRHPLEREYLAVATGTVTPVSGVIDGPIAREPGHPLRRQVSPGGAPARTHYMVVAQSQAATVLQLRLETGRTHQIRVHLAHLGHPLLGDRLYGGDLSLLSRQALHARRVRFTHPRTGAETEIAAPVPADLANLIAMLALDPAGS